MERHLFRSAARRYDRGDILHQVITQLFALQCKGNRRLQEPGFRTAVKTAPIKAIAIDRNVARNILGDCIGQLDFTTGTLFALVEVASGMLYNLKLKIKFDVLMFVGEGWGARNGGRGKNQI